MNRCLPGALLGQLLCLTLGAASLSSQAIEESKYEVIRQFDNVELRQYASYVVAEVVLEATAEDAGSRAFPISAGYIVGKDKGERKFAMTAPVTQTAVPSGICAQFVLREGVMLESAPEPLNPQVRLRLLPAGQWAAIRYSGTWSQANDDEHLGKLQAALAAAGVVPQDRPVLARYNGPMTPWFMRRNENLLAPR